jgi:glycosyltransferase involved in cell wall biosynthesis
LLLVNKKVLLVTSTNLACNPRCLKELKLLVSNGAKVTVVAFYLDNWTNALENNINKEFEQVKFIYLKATKTNNYFNWLVATVVQLLSSLLLKLFPKAIFINAMAASKSTWILYRFFKKSNVTANLVIAHNPAAFYPAAYVAKKNAVPLAIDIEDYHPGESKIATTSSKSIAILMAAILPTCSYTSYASPLIKEYTVKLLNANLHHAVVVNNNFSALEYQAPPLKSNSEKLQLVWFSQYIDYGRGLELLLPVLDKFSTQITVTLIGNNRTTFYQHEIANRSYINCKSSMPHAVLQHELGNYDIGLAIEDGSVNINRDICLTNKIWSYFQSGLFIFATNTAAQNEFMNQHHQHGLVTAINENDFYSNILNLINNAEQIKINQARRYENAQLFSWENESKKLIALWEEIL